MDYTNYQDKSYHIPDIKLHLYIKDLILNNFNNKATLYIKYFPNSKRESAEANSSRLIHSDRFKVALDSILAEEQVHTLLTRGWVLQQLLDRYHKAPKDSDKLRALEDISKILKYAEDKPAQMAIFQQVEQDLRALDVKRKEIKK